MFHNIGDKLMTAATWVALLGCDGAVFVGIAYCFSGIVAGLLIGIFGRLSALLLSMVLWVLDESEHPRRIVRGGIYLRFRGNSVGAMAVLPGFHVF